MGRGRLWATRLSESRMRGNRPLGLTSGGDGGWDATIETRAGKAGNGLCRRLNHRGSFRRWSVMPAEKTPDPFIRPRAVPGCEYPEPAAPGQARATWVQMAMGPGLWCASPESGPVPGIRPSSFIRYSSPALTGAFPVPFPSSAVPCVVFFIVFLPSTRTVT